MAEGVDFEAMLDEYREMMAGYKATIAELREDRKADRESITRLEGKVSELVEQLSAAERGEYKPADMDTLFDELIDGLNDYIYNHIPKSVREDIEALGKTVTVETAFGPERLAATFCTTYANSLETQLYATPPSEGSVVTIYERSITDQTINDTKAWVDKKCKEYTKAERKLKRPRETRHKGAYGQVMSEWNVVKREWGGVDKATAEEDDSYKYAKTRYDDMVTLKGRVNAYLQACGYFLLYTSLRNIPMSDVDAKIVVQFQDFIEENAGSSAETLGKFADVCKLYFSWLAGDGYMPEIPKRGKGSIPPRKYETGATSKKPHPAFALTITEDRAGRITLDPDECELCKVYRCVRKVTTGTDKNLAREPKLIEICLRIQQETGLRRRFLLNLMWKDFTEEPVLRMPGGETIYQIKLERLREAVHRNKLLPEKDMYISGTLGRMINAYREKKKDVLRPHFPVFNAMLLLGPYRDRTYAAAIDGSLWRRMIALPLEAKCKINVSPMKFRNTYYTIMLAALERGAIQPGQEEAEPKSFALWTGDKVSTAKKNYKAVEGVINLPDSYIGTLEYKEIVTHIFGIQKVWDSDKHKWK